MCLPWVSSRLSVNLGATQHWHGSTGGGMQQRKRTQSLRHIELEFGRPAKRIKLMHEGGAECILPIQPELELGPFWTTTPYFCVIHQHSNHCLDTDCSLGSWGVQQQVSVSFMDKSVACPSAIADDEDTLDTASSGSEGNCCGLQHENLPARPPQASGVGEEDSISSNQAVAPCMTFSFGSRPCVTPDLSAVLCWDIVDGLLAAMS